MDIPKMHFSADFNPMQENNPSNWTQSIGGINGSKRLEEVAPSGSDGTHSLSVSDRQSLQQALGGDAGGGGNGAYGGVVLDSFTSGRSGGNGMPTTSATLPADMTTAERMATSPTHEVGSMTNPNTLGESLGKLVEGVHDKTAEYETQSNALINKDKGSMFDVAKDSMFSDYQSLSGVDKKETQKSDIEKQIEGFTEVMNSSYEYYIYSSLLVDSGKSISQTAQTLTKG